jgi:hypothetical protein
MTNNREPDDPSGGAHIDDDELTEAAGAPLPGEGHGDPLMDSEPTAEMAADPDTGLPAGREAQTHP